MEDELAFLVLLGLLLFFIWYISRKSSTTQAATKAAASTSATSALLDMDMFDVAPVPLEVIQAVIEKFQSTQEDMVPLETLYFNPGTSGSYNARLMFLNTRHFFGQQFDINASISPSGDVTINNTESTSDPVSYVNSYVPDSYRRYSDINSSMNEQLKSALTTVQGTKFQEDLKNSFNTSFEGRLSQKDLLTRASLDTEKINF
jgi:hypothetical protein